MEKQEQKKLQVFLTLKEHEALMKICQVKDRTITGQIRAWIKSTQQPTGGIQG